MTNDVFSFNTGNINKFLVGYDKIFNNLREIQENYTKSALNNWPFYNIVKVDDDKYRIDLAVAGFAKTDIDIELANNVLIVKGSVSENQSESSEKDYIFKGIADRAFTRKFTLADHVEVKNAEYINGMLKIWLNHLIPEEKKSRKVDIK